MQEYLDLIMWYDYIWTVSNWGQNLEFDDFLKIGIWYLFVMRMAIVVWVTKDIINRTNNIFLQILAILIVLLWTPLSLSIYLLIRPSKTLFEQNFDMDYEEDYEHEHEWSFKCPNCDFLVYDDYKYCPNCKICLKKECVDCGKIMEKDWVSCPYCGSNQEVKVEEKIEEEVDEILLTEKKKKKKSKKDKTKEDVKSKVKKLLQKD